MRVNTSKIKAILAERDMAQKDLAAIAGMSSQSISAILTRGTCELKNAGKIARGLNVPVSEIMKEV